MSEEKDAAANSLVPADGLSLAQYSSKIVVRGLDLALKLNLLAARPIRLLVVDDIPQTREIIKELLSFENDIEIVGYGENGVDAIEQFEILRPDCVMIDTHMPIMDGLAATAEICTRHPDANIIVATIHEPARYAQAARSAGAKAYLLEPFSVQELRSAILEVAKGRMHPSALVNDIQGLREYYADAGLTIDTLVDMLAKMNTMIADDVLGAKPHANESREPLHIGLTPFLRPNLQAEIESIWHFEVEQYLNDLEEYLHKPGRYKDFRWDKVQGKILRSPAASKFL